LFSNYAKIENRPANWPIEYRAKNRHYGSRLTMASIISAIDSTISMVLDNGQSI